MLSVGIALGIEISRFALTARQVRVFGSQSIRLIPYGALTGSPSASAAASTRWNGGSAEKADSLRRRLFTMMLR